MGVFLKQLGPQNVPAFVEKSLTSGTMTSTQFAAVTAIAASIKILLTPCYHSTDLEVHRNWMAITHSLPIKSWYFEASSEWTLDYPPFFAYFEWLLSHIAAFFDKDIVKLSKMPIESAEAILFQRFSVILGDFFLIFAAWRFVHSVSFLSSASTHLSDGPTTLSISPAERCKKLAAFSMIVLNVGLLLVDHIHFQYNGLLIGLLILSFDAANRGEHTMLTVCFSILVLMKHLFVFFVPVFGLYLLRSYCGWDGFNFGTDSQIEPFDLIIDSDSSCYTSNSNAHGEGSPAADKVSSIKPLTALDSSLCAASSKGKRKKKKQTQNVLQVGSTEERSERTVYYNKNEKKCQKLDVTRENGKKTVHFFKRFSILVSIAIVALTLAFGPFVIDIDLPGLQGDSSLSFSRTGKCRKISNSVSDFSDEIEDGNIACINSDNATDKETGKKRRLFISVEYKQITQIFQRLFPFGRGLVHAYWAPNVWAIYCGVDKTVDLIIRKRKQIGRILLRKFRDMRPMSRNIFWLSNIYLRKFSNYGGHLIKIWNKNDNLTLMAFKVSIEIDIIKNYLKSQYHNIEDKIVSNFKIIANSEEFKSIKENGLLYLKNSEIHTSADGEIFVSSSAGLIGNFRLFILPNISASMALFFTVMSMFPAFFVLVYNRKRCGLPQFAGHLRREVYCGSISAHGREGIAVRERGGVGGKGSVEGEAKGGTTTGTGTGTGIGAECVKGVVRRDHRVSHTDTNKNNINNANTSIIKQEMSNSIKPTTVLVTPTLLIRSVLYTSLCSFMLGYHVHEKAILIPMLCAAMISSRSHRDAVLFLKLSAIGVFSLFPLFTGIDELMIKSFFLLTYISCCWKYFEKETKDENWSLKTNFSILFVVFVFTEIIHPYYFVYLPSVQSRDKVDTAILPFLPLMTVSCVCGLLLIPCWIEAGILLFKHDGMTD